MAHTTGKGKDTAKAHSSKLYETLASYSVVLVVLLVIFILGGGVYDILKNPSALVATSTGYSSIYPYSSEQTINESIVAMFLYACGFVGVLLVYRSTKVLYDKSKANLQIMVGMGLAMIGVVGAYILLALKS